MGEMVDRVLNEPEILIDALIEMGDIYFEKKSVIIEGQHYHKNKGPCFGAVHDLFNDYCRRGKPQDGSLVKLFFYKLLEDKGTASAKIPLIRDLTRKIIERVGEMTPEEEPPDYGKAIGGGVYGIARDIYTNGRFVYHRKNFELTGIHAEALLESAPKDCAKEIIQDAVNCKVIFNPRVIDRSWNERIDEGGEELDVTCFNIFNAPPYRKVDAPTPECLSEIDPNLLEYFDTLCHNSEETKNVILSWLKVALLDRAKTILVLVGQGATGKSFLARLFGRLVGADYFMQAQNEFFDSRFVSGLNKNRCIFIDEGDMSNPRRVAHAKKYVEDTFSAEEKGKEAIANQLIHASLIYASNYTSSLALSPNERKFTVPDAGDTPQRWGSIAEWNAFEERMLNDPRKLKMLFNFLEAFETEWQPTTNYRGEKFWDIVYDGGLNDTQKHICHRLSELKEPLDLDTFKVNCNRGSNLRVNNNYIKNLLHQFELGGRPIGEITPTGEIRKISTGNDTEEDDFFSDDFADGLDLL